MEMGMWMGGMGKWAISLAFATSLGALIGYAATSLGKRNLFQRSAMVFYLLHLLFVSIASLILLQLLLSHDFSYYYVYNHTSTTLETRYLISAFWGGQEGSFLLWILLSGFIGVGMMRWVEEPYRSPVLFILTLNQLLLLSMILGWDLRFASVGTSPFRSIAEAFPNAPFLQANPNFVPAEGKGLNDLLKSPWMVIHPPALFLGFSMMGVPYAFAMAALWTRKYQEWVKPALPWAIAANLSLFIAIFLGGYWAYVTLSFGGYWAWDPVENASILPWMVGLAGIHFMLILRTHAGSLRLALVFAILSYALVVYEAFLTRSGILGDASVHSFTDLGLYNQLLLFILVVLGSGAGLMAFRWRELPDTGRADSPLQKEGWIYSGSLILFTLAFVIAIGTSSPIVGRLFTENPTPPEISFYSNWSLPFAILLACFTVVGQLLFWKRQSYETLVADLIWPVSLASMTTLISLFLLQMKSMLYIAYLFSAWFAVFGNGLVLLRLVKKNVSVLGGTLSHLGFGIMLVGFLFSSAFQSPLLDEATQAYNKAMKEGKVVDESGFPMQDPIEFVELKKGEPKLLNGRYLLTYEGRELTNQSRRGQHAYLIRIEEVDDGESLSSRYLTTLKPEVYPMSSGTSLNWSVDVDVMSSIVNDLYMYVAGSSFVEERNRAFQQQNSTIPHAAGTGGQASSGQDWVLLIAQEKPFVSLVWAGVFLLMIGSSFSIFRYWNRLRAS